MYDELTATKDNLTSDAATKKAPSTPKRRGKPNLEPVKDIPESFVIPPNPEKVIVVDIEGDAEGMLQNKLRPETKEELLYGKKSGASETRAQRTDRAKAAWKDTGHLTKDGVRGHPSEAFLKAMMQAVTMVSLSGGKKTSNKAAILRCVSVLPDAFSKEGLPLCKFSQSSAVNAGVEPSEHWANNKNSGGTPVPVFRTHIQGGWTMSVRVAYDSSVMRAQDILMLMQKAGTNVGIGPWRKEKGGVFGRWKVVGAKAAS